MQFIIFFLIVFSVMALGYGYVGWRLIGPSNLQHPWNIIAWAVVIIAFILPIASVTLDRTGNENISAKLAWLTYTSMGLFSLLFTFLIIKDAGLLLIFIFKKIGSLFSATQQNVFNEPVNPGRRLMMKQSVNLAIVGISAGLTAYGIYEARRKPALIEKEIPVNGLPSSLENFRIVQITDVHAGLTVRRKFIEQIVDMVNDLKPDLIAFTGDMVDGSVSALSNDVEPFSRLRAQHGTYFVTGNHEYYSGVEQWVAEAKRLGMKVLVNSHDVINIGGAKLLIAGVTDPTGKDFLESHRSDPGIALSNAPTCDAKILLAHQPKSLYSAMPFGFDLLITGHTHGGQFFPWNLAAAAGQPYVSGLHNHEGTWIYVSKGTGYWGPPVRIGTRSEITIFRLTQKQNIA